MNTPESFDSLRELQELYLMIPETLCLEKSCSNQCCTKMPSPRDQGNCFMPLPLIYGIEYLNILRWIEEQYPGEPVSRLFDFSRNSRLCPFKDPETHFCKIYPVRPFSCRMYGRDLPPFFWGVEVTRDQARAVFCQKLKIEEEEKQDVFLKAYESLWDMLARLSFLTPPFDEQKQKIIESVTGFPVILILAFGEFHLLNEWPLEVFEKEFPEYWKKMGELF